MRERSRDEEELLEEKRKLKLIRLRRVGISLQSKVVEVRGLLGASEVI